MGFPSPATDYTESTLTVNSICRIDANCRVIETESGYAVIDRSLRPQDGEVVLAQTAARIQFAKWYGGSLITEDGEAIEGDSLDDVEVYGVVTFTITGLYHDDGVV